MDSVAGRFALTIVRTQAGAPDRVSIGTLVLDRRHEPLQAPGSPVAFVRFGILTARPGPFYEAARGLPDRRTSEDTLWVRLRVDRERADYTLVGTGFADYGLLPLDQGAYFQILAAQQGRLVGTWSDGTYHDGRTHRGGRFCAERVDPATSEPPDGAPDA